MATLTHYLTSNHIYPKTQLSHLCKQIDTSSSVSETHHDSVTPVQNKLIKFYHGLQIVQEQPEEQSAIKKFPNPDEVTPDVRRLMDFYRPKPPQAECLPPATDDDDLREYDQIVQNLKKELLAVGIVLPDTAPNNVNNNNSIEFNISPSHVHSDNSSNDQKPIITSSYSLDPQKDDSSNCKAEILKLIMDESLDDPSPCDQKLLQMGSMLDHALKQSLDQLKEKEKENVQVIDTYQVKSNMDSPIAQKCHKDENSLHKEYTTFQTVQSQQLTSSQIHSKVQCLQPSNKLNHNVLASKVQNSQYFNECRYSLPMKQSISTSNLMPPKSLEDEYFDPFQEPQAKTCTNQKKKKKIILLDEVPKIRREGFQMTKQVPSEKQLRNPMIFHNNLIEQKTSKKEQKFHFHQIKEVKPIQQLKKEKQLSHPVTLRTNLSQPFIGTMEQPFQAQKIEQKGVNQMKLIQKEMNLSQPALFDINVIQKQQEDIEQTLQLLEMEEFVKKQEFTTKEYPKNKELDQNFLQKLAEEVIDDDLDDSIEKLPPMSDRKQNDSFLQQITNNFKQREKEREKSYQLFETENKSKGSIDKSKTLKRCPSFMERVEKDLQRRQIRKEISQKVKEKLDKEQEKEFQDYLRRKEGFYVALYFSQEKVRKRSTSRKAHERLYQEAQNRKERQQRDSMKREKEKQSLQMIVTDRRIMNNVDRYLSLTKGQNAETIFQSLYQ